MKILVLSDSHGKVGNMVQAVEKEAPERIFHLGDCCVDGERLRARFPEIPFEQVPGNCDGWRRGEPEKLVVLEGKRILLCHGHTYGVKSSMLTAGMAAEEKKLDLFLYGHTHEPAVLMRGKTLFLNPGSIGDYTRPSYGLVLIENGKVDVKTQWLR